MDSNDELKNYISDWLANATRNANGVEDFLDARARIFRAAEVAVAEVANAWNTRASPRSRELPSEVLAHCFTYLKLSDCLKIMSICRHWHAVLFSDSRIWSDYAINIRKEHQIHDLKKWLGRTGSLPFNLIFNPYYGESPSLLLGVLKECNGRIRRLTIKTYVAVSLDGYSFPLLESLRMACHVTGLPHAPLLRTLKIESLELNEVGFEFVHLTEFSGCLSGSKAANFFQVCPKLGSLTLSSYNDKQSVLPHGPAPSSITQLSLVSHGYLGAADHSLNAFTRCKMLHDIRLHGTGFSAQRVLKLFHSLGSPPEKLSFDIYTFFLAGHSPARSLSLSRNGTGSWGRAPITDMGGRLDMSNIREVSIVLVMLRFEQLLSFPALTHMTLDIEDNISDTVNSIATRFVAPRLHTIELSCHIPFEFRWRSIYEIVSDLANTFPDVCTSLSIPRLQALVITGHQVTEDVIDRTDFACLRLCTDHLYHGERELAFDRVQVNTARVDVVTQSQ